MCTAEMLAQLLCVIQLPRGYKDFADVSGCRTDQDACMKRDLPDDVVRQQHQVPRGMLASRTFWAGGALSAGLWALLFFMMR